ncbi:MAG: hypothetical protein JJE04_09110, partial [Acidobacteriia bacterium]|nr:hypothetical protein [Terriglobia bacterium]
GVFHLSWRAERDGDWAERIEAELAGIREHIKKVHGTRLRFLIWAGMGGSAEDKSMYNAAGLLSRGPRCYVLDSTDPAKLKYILEDMQRRSKLSLKQVLQSTLVVGMALGMTSYEPVVNLEKINALYEKHKLDSRPNFLYMTMPGSLLDQFAKPRGYARVELQMDGGNSTSGRHSGPLTRGSLYPLGLAGVDLREWIEATYLDKEQIDTAWQLSSFLHSHGVAGRDKVTLLLPKPWEGAGLWTKQNFEESLGKSESIGIKIVIGEKVKLANYRSPKEPRQDRVFLAFQQKGLDGPDKTKLSILRRAGYPLAIVTIPPGTPLSGYMQFIHYAVFGIGYLRGMNFVTQPSVELYKAITGRIHAAAQKQGGIENTKEWQRMKDPATTLRYRGCISIHLHHLKNLPDALASPQRAVQAPDTPEQQPATPPERVPFCGLALKSDAAACYAALLRSLAGQGAFDYGELSYFGDLRYCARGRAMRKCLDRAAESVFRSRLKAPVDVYEGPAMNHSYHEMIIGHGGCFSTVLLSERPEQLPAAGYTAAYHRAQFLATQMALAERGRAVAAILVKDLEENTLRHLDEFFRQVAAHLK